MKKRNSRRGKYEVEVMKQVRRNIKRHGYAGAVQIALRPITEALNSGKQRN